MWYFTACRYDHACGHRYENCNEKIKKLFCVDEVLTVQPDVIKNATHSNFLVSLVGILKREFASYANPKSDSAVYIAHSYITLVGDQSVALIYAGNVIEFVPP